MPVYDYDCPQCGPFEAQRSIAQYNQPAPCPHCRTQSERVVLSAPRLGLVSAYKKRAVEINEKSAHEPIQSRNYDYDADKHLARKRHPVGCSCCASGPINPGLTRIAANGNKSFPTKRPWMISH